MARLLSLQEKDIILDVLGRAGHPIINGDCEIVLLEGDQSELRHWLATGALDLVITYDIGEAFEAAITPICKFPAHAIKRSDEPLAGQEAVNRAGFA